MTGLRNSSRKQCDLSSVREGELFNIISFLTSDSNKGGNEDKEKEELSKNDRSIPPKMAGLRKVESDIIQKWFQHECRTTVGPVIAVVAVICATYHLKQDRGVQ